MFSREHGRAFRARNRIAPRRARPRRPRRARIEGPSKQEGSGAWRLFRRHWNGAASRRLRRADAKPAIADREDATDRHHHAAEPNQGDQRLPIDARRDGAAGRGIAEARIELAEAERLDAGFGRGLAIGEINTLSGLDRRDNDPAPSYFEAADFIAPVRSLTRRQS